MQVTTNPRDRKEKNIGARVSIEFFKEVENFIRLTNLHSENDESTLSMGKLIRMSVKRYMLAHPPIKVREVNE